MLVSDTSKAGDDVIQPRSSAWENIYSCSWSLEGVAIEGLAQELIKHSSEATESL